MVELKGDVLKSYFHRGRLPWVKKRLLSLKIRDSNPSCVENV